MKQQLIESQSNIGLPDFVTMTNEVESKGYEVELIRSKKGITCDIYKDGELKKVGSNVYSTSIDAQKESYTKLFLAIFKNK